MSSSNEKTLLADLRKDYGVMTLRKKDLLPDPFSQLEKWLQDALHHGCPEPNAMTLATVSADGQPSARIVLLKKITPDGLRFYTHKTSRKGRDISANNKVALVFHWHQLERQVNIRGTAREIPRNDVEDYFHTRPRASQLGAACSPQSRIVPNREALELAFQKLSEEYSDKPIPLPTTWTGYDVLPTEFEFWQGRQSRLHDRFIYHRLPGQTTWLIDRLGP